MFFLQLRFIKNWLGVAVGELIGDGLEFTPTHSIRGGLTVCLAIDRVRRNFDYRNDTNIVQIPYQILWHCIQLFFSTEFFLWRNETENFLRIGILHCPLRISTWPILQTPITRALQDLVSRSVSIRGEYPSYLMPLFGYH